MAGVATDATGARDCPVAAARGRRGGKGRLAREGRAAAEELEATVLCAVAAHGAPVARAAALLLHLRWQQ